MNEVIAGVLRWVLRLVVLMIGLLVFISLLAAALVLAALWALRALWARLTGRPVTPWVMRMDPRTGFSTAFRSTQHWSSPKSAHTAGNDVDAVQPEPSARRGGILPGADVDVTDVKARDIG
ncbi:MAG: hypothetical protein K2Q97_08735 [Burkholderiaceae bacterium]|nr:hypothetical protein [Burkholderiaceae bacterium]